MARPPFLMRFWGLTVALPSEMVIDEFFLLTSNHWQAMDCVAFRCRTVRYIEPDPKNAVLDNGVRR